MHGRFYGFDLIKRKWWSWKTLIDTLDSPMKKSTTDSKAKGKKHRSVHEDAEVLF